MPCTLPLLHPLPRVRARATRYDVSLPVTQLYELVDLMKERTEGVAITCCGYGHLGDGNLHLNITGTSESSAPSLPPPPINFLNFTFFKGN